MEDSHYPNSICRPARQVQLSAERVYWSWHSGYGPAIGAFSLMMLSPKTKECRQGGCSCCRLISDCLKVFFSRKHLHIKHYPKLVSLSPSIYSGAVPNVPNQEQEAAQNGDLSPPTKETEDSTSKHAQSLNENRSDSMYWLYIMR